MARMALELDYARAKEVENITWAFLVALVVVVLATAVSSVCVAGPRHWAAFWNAVTRVMH